MSADANMMRAALRKALDRVGRNNGHSMQPSDSNIDPLMHELFIAAEASAYFKQRHDKAKDAMFEAAGVAREIEDAVASVIKNMAGTSLIAADGQLYQMTIDISKPSKRLNQAALRTYLQTTHGMSREEVEKAFDAASTYASPAKKVKVLTK